MSTKMQETKRVTVVREIREDAEGVGNETSFLKVTKSRVPDRLSGMPFYHSVGEDGRKKWCYP